MCHRPAPPPACLTRGLARWPKRRPCLPTLGLACDTPQIRRLTAARGAKAITPEALRQIIHDAYGVEAA